MDLFAKLNDKQTLSVQSTEGYVRVIAGAGSGKTKLLVSRYAYLVHECGIGAGNILCVTFTNKAAGEMKKRIASLIGSEHSSSLICTYHGFCARLIRENPEKLFLSKGFQIIDTWQQRSILEEIYQKYELKLDYASFQSILKKIALKKRDLSYVARMKDAGDVQILGAIEDDDDRIIEDYLRRQKAVYSLDFEDLMNYALWLLKTDGEVREKWQERLNYIMVDEFQDSASTEMELIDILSERYGNLMIVGDPDQNIYEWRGSDVRLLVDFDKKHDGTKTIILNQNYRSTPQILRCANTLIEKNELRLKKDLFTLAESGAPVTHIHAKSEEDEVSAIVKEIKAIRISQKKTYSDFAVLYRSGFLSRVIERKLVEENIPYEIYGGVKFYSRMEIQDVVAYLRLIAFSDDLSFRRIVNTPRRQFGRSRLAALETIRENNELTLFEQENITQKSLYEVLKLHLGDPAFSGSGGAAFVSFIESMRSLKDSLRISELVNRVCTDSGYERYIRELGDEERLDNLSEFKRIASEFESGFGEDVSLEGFLQQIALMSAEDEEKPGESVKLMTIHASKGLEFPVVFAIGFSEGIFPSSRTIEERKKLGLEEERRLCYVAITRARETLFLTDSEGLSQQGIRKLPSRFLHEIGEENYRRLGKISEDLESESIAYIRRLNISIAEGLPRPDDGGLRRVEHHIFGKGEILSFDEKRGVYSVQFEGMRQPRAISADYFSRGQRAEFSERECEPLGEYEDDDDEEVEESEFQIQEAFEESDCDEAEEIEEETIDDPLEADAVPADEAQADGGEIPDELRRRLEDAPNHWDDPDFPKNGWTCTGMTDLGSRSGICEMCGYQIIRYVHHMYHAERGIALDCGCVCAGRMEGDEGGAKKREAAFKNRQKRKGSFLRRQWKRSAKGHEYLKIKNHLVVLFHFKDSGRWHFSLDGTFRKKAYASRKETVEAAFEALDGLLYGRNSG